MTKKDVLIMKLELLAADQRRAEGQRQRAEESKTEAIQLLLDYVNDEEITAAFLRL